MAAFERVAQVPPVEVPVRVNESVRGFWRAHKLRLSTSDGIVAVQIDLLVFALWSTQPRLPNADFTPHSCHTQSLA
ncbi:MAG: hypothetical protein AAGG65_00485 [Pseudomonadota bacterium]